MTNKITIEDINKVSSPRNFKTLLYFYNKHSSYIYEVMKNINEISYKNTHKHIKELEKYGFIEYIGNEITDKSRLIKLYKLSKKGEYIIESINNLID